MPPLSSGANLLSHYPRPLLLGHRGARAYAPENTIKAFELAIEQGCDGFEFDVRLTADSQAVICHDPKFKRVQIARAEAAALSILGLPTLVSVLEQFAGCAFLDVELKVPGLERITIDLLRRFPLLRGAVVTSFLPEVLREMHALDGSVPVGLICQNRSQMAAASNLPMAAIVLHMSLVSREVVAHFRDRGTSVFVWGAKHPEEMRSIAEAGADALIIDDTQLAVQTFRADAHAAGNP